MDYGHTATGATGHSSPITHHWVDYQCLGGVLLMVMRFCSTVM